MQQSGADQIRLRSMGQVQRESEHIRQRSCLPCTRPGWLMQLQLIQLHFCYVGICKQPRVALSSKPKTEVRQATGCSRACDTWRGETPGTCHAVIDSQYTRQVNCKAWCSRWENRLTHKRTPRLPDPTLSTSPPSHRPIWKPEVCAQPAGLHLGQKGWTGGSCGSITWSPR